MNCQTKLDSIKKLLKGEVPQIDISQLLLKHKCMFLLEQVTAKKNHPLLTAEKIYNQTMIKRRFEECKSIFKTIDFPYAIVKGVALSKTIYNDPFVRLSNDIDILVSKKYVASLKQTLLAAGFVQGRIINNKIVAYSRQEILFQTSFTHQTAPFIKSLPTKSPAFVNLDVNFDVLWGEANKTASTDYVLSQTVDCELFDITFKKLTPEMEFIHLCLHHYKDMNSLLLLYKRGLQLYLFCEIYDFLIRVPLNIEKLCNICQDLKVGKYVYACIYQTNELFEDIDVKKWLELLASHRDDSLLNTFGLTDQQRKKWELSLVERIFHPNLSKYIFDNLCAEEKEMIKLNQMLM